MRNLLMMLFALACSGTGFAATQVLSGRILDSESETPLAARLYVQAADGSYYVVETASPEGQAVPYDKIRGRSQEVHTTLSAHPFTIRLPRGRYSLTAERGKEYFPSGATVEVGDQPVEVVLKLRRFFNLAERGWYSGETHTHRRMNELPTVMLAEDLNVTLPLNYWVTDSTETPDRHNRNPEQVPPAKLIKVDATHVIWPINTEYEIFSVKRKRHTLGAVFILNHRKPFTVPAPPVRPIAEEARKQGAILDLDKHNWPWSMMLLPTMKVDLFELTNNHIWRTDFMFKTWYAGYAPAYMKVEKDETGHLTERGWIDFGLQNYYALLNCGFDIKPSAGTASGVHPVPLGFGRVYVHLADGFDYTNWMAGLKQGRSFVTTGPLLDARFNDKLPGETFTAEGETFALKVSAACRAIHATDRIEVIVNGQVKRSVRAPSQTFVVDLSLAETSWVALRVFTRTEEGRPRFAHTAPVYVRFGDQSIRPRRKEVAYLLKRVEDEIARNRGVLTEAEVKEFEEAADFYRELLPRATD